MLEKSSLLSKFIICIVTISMFLLVLSSMFLLQITNSSFMSKSVFKLILANNTSISLKDMRNKQTKLSFLSSNSSKAKDKTRFSRKVTKSCNQVQSPLKVFLYDLPPEFHFGQLDFDGNANRTWPNVNNRREIPPYPSGLYLQHSVEYWLTLDILASNANKPCRVLIVQNSSEADIVFVPFFASLSYNRHAKHQGRGENVDKMLQSKLVEFVTARDEWKRFGGKDHLIVAHHPNSLLHVRNMLGSAMFVLSDFGRYPIEVANLEKDIIAPYKHVVRAISSDKSAPFEKRPILVYFQGAIYRKDGGIIRQELHKLLKNKKDVHFKFGTARGSGIKEAGKGMTLSKFCLNIAGDTPSSNRLFDAIASHCVPIIISDELELPFEDILDYTEFCIFVRASDAVRPDYLLNLVRGIDREQWTKMWETLKQITCHFEYQFPSRCGDAVDMIWRAVLRKISSVRMNLHRQKRYNTLYLTENFENLSG